MTYDAVFDSTENRALLAVCARKTIRTAAIIGIVWGAINLVIGFFAIQVNILNAGILGLGLLMLGAGVAAIRKPSLHCLLMEAVVSILLVFWNVGITILNVRTGHADHVEGHGLIFPVIAAIVFFNQYRKLGHLKDAIGLLDHEMVKRAATLCKQLFKSRLKQSPDVVQATSRRYRIRLMNDAVFCAHQNLAQAFHMTREQLQTCMPDLKKKKLSMVVRHPLGKVVCHFDKKNSEKIKAWLSINAGPAI